MDEEARVLKAKEAPFYKTPEFQKKIEEWKGSLPLGCEYIPHQQLVDDGWQLFPQEEGIFYRSPEGRMNFVRYGEGEKGGATSYRVYTATEYERKGTFSRPVKFLLIATLPNSESPNPPLFSLGEKEVTDDLLEG